MISEGTPSMSPQKWTPLVQGCWIPCPCPQRMNGICPLSSRPWGRRAVLSQQVSLAALHALKRLKCQP